MKAETHSSDSLVAVFLVFFEGGDGVVGVDVGLLAGSVGGSALDLEFGRCTSEEAPEGLGHKVRLHTGSPALVVGASEEGDGVEGVVGHVELVVSVWRVVCCKPQNKTVVSVIVATYHQKRSNVSGFERESVPTSLQKVSSGKSVDMPKQAWDLHPSTVQRFPMGATRWSANAMAKETQTTRVPPAVKRLKRHGSSCSFVSRAG